ncbi:hypothetical protein P4K18_27060 [Bacillus cereus]|nr:hypothetical protein [Bacillus cereus]
MNTKKIVGAAVVGFSLLTGGILTAMSVKVIDQGDMQVLFITEVQELKRKP